MRVVVTGNLGLIGSALTDALKACHAWVYGIDDRSSNVVGYDESPADGQALMDVADPIAFEMTAEEDDIDLIIHCAAPVGPANMRPEREVAWQIMRGTHAALDAAIYHHARLVMFSTSEVYSYRSGDTSIRAQYALGKLAAEAMVLGSFHPHVQVVRPFNVTGPRQRPEGGYVLPRFVSQAQAGQPLTIFGDGSQRRSFTHISDLVAFTLALVTNWPVRKQVWNVSNPDNYISIMELARLVTQLYGGGDVRPHCDAKRELANPHWEESDERGDGSADTRYRSWFWQPKVTLREMVEELLGRRTIGAEVNA